MVIVRFQIKRPKFLTDALKIPLPRLQSIPRTSFPRKKNMSRCSSKGVPLRCLFSQIILVPWRTICYLCSRCSLLDENVQKQHSAFYWKSKYFFWPVSKNNWDFHTKTKLLVMLSEMFPKNIIWTKLAKKVNQKTWKRTQLKIFK